ncbi:unnamed protein product, partial [Gongylonema pulchrum]|uniref:Akirin n=1 Tax=Gongylonema pulchrum TaxID=637853 RepID=A0A183EK76_9BILA
MKTTTLSVPEEAPLFQELLQLSKLFYLLCRVHVNSIQILQCKKSTVRRSNIFRELGAPSRYRRNFSHPKRASDCECLKQPLLTQSNDAEMFLKDTDKSNSGCTSADHKYRNSIFMEQVAAEQILPRLKSARPQMLEEFEERFRVILKRVYRSLQQHEIREEVIYSMIIDERRRIQWQWQQLATVVDRLLL